MMRMSAAATAEIMRWTRYCSDCGRSTIHDEILVGVLQCRSCLTCSTPLGGDGDLRLRLWDAVRRIPGGATCS